MKAKRRVKASANGGEPVPVAPARHLRDAPRDLVAHAMAALDVLPAGLVQLPDGDRDVHAPPDADHALGEDVLALGRPVARADLLPGRDPEVVGDEPADLAVPRALGRRLAQLLVERGGEGDPRDGADRTEKVVHARTLGAGVVPGFRTGIPAAHCGQDSGA